MQLLCASFAVFVIRLMSCDSFSCCVSFVALPPPPICRATFRMLLVLLFCDSFDVLRYVYCFAIRLQLCVSFIAVRLVCCFSMRVLFRVSCFRCCVSFQVQLSVPICNCIRNVLSLFLPVSLEFLF